MAYSSLTATSHKGYGKKKPSGGGSKGGGGSSGGGYTSPTAALGSRNYGGGGGRRSSGSSGGVYAAATRGVTSAARSTARSSAGRQRRPTSTFSQVARRTTSSLRPRVLQSYVEDPPEGTPLSRVLSRIEATTGTRPSLRVDRRIDGTQAARKGREVRVDRAEARRLVQGRKPSLRAVAATVAASKLPKKKSPQETARIASNYARAVVKGSTPAPRNTQPEANRRRIAAYPDRKRVPDRTPKRDARSRGPNQPASLERASKIARRQLGVRGREQSSPQRVRQQQGRGKGQVSRQALRKLAQRFPQLAPVVDDLASASRIYGIPPEILASHYGVETNFGELADVTSSAGAEGPMQFLPSTWATQGVDSPLDKDKRADIMSTTDAIHSAANYLANSGFKDNPRDAIFAYNHADWYVDDVLEGARQFQAPKLWNKAAKGQIPSISAQGGRAAAVNGEKLKDYSGFKGFIPDDNTVLQFQRPLGNRLRRLAKATGPLNFNSGFRTRAEQEAAYADYQAGGTLAAKPGSSNHEFGAAADISFTPEQRAALGRFGLGLPVPGEDWHVEVTGNAASKIQNAATGARVTGSGKVIPGGAGVPVTGAPAPVSTANVGATSSYSPAQVADTAAAAASGERGSRAAARDLYLMLSGGGSSGATSTRSPLAARAPLPARYGNLDPRSNDEVDDELYRLFND